MEEEIWRAIPNYEDLYEVSNLGRVRSLNYRRSGKVQVLKLSTKQDGYLQVTLRKDCKRKYHLIHRLVAETFLENPNNLPCVNHKDENKQNNNVSNLEFCSYEYNNNYGSRNERAANTRNKKVICLELKRIFNSVTEASKFVGCTRGNVSHAINNRGKCKGYTFKYIESEVM